MNVTIEFSTWRALLWVRLMQIAAPFIGRDRAERLAADGVMKRVRFREVGARKWSHIT